MRRSSGQGPYPTQHCARQISLYFFLLQQWTQTLSSTSLLQNCNTAFNFHSIKYLHQGLKFTLWFKTRFCKPFSYCRPRPNVSVLVWKWRFVFSVLTYRPLERVKKVTENASFQKRSREWRFWKRSFTSIVWIGEKEVFENDYVTGSDTSKCPCPNKRWYRFQSLLCFWVKGQKRSKNAACGRRFFFKTWCRRYNVSRYFWKRGFCLRFSSPSTQCYRNYTVLFKSVKCATCGRVFPWKRRKNSRFSEIPWYVWTQGLRENLCCCNSCYTVGSLSNDVSEQRTSTEVDFLHSSAVILNKFLGKTSL